jgi:hypothetical protein
MKVRDIRKRAKTPYTPIGDGLVFLRDFKAKRCRTYSMGCPVCDGWRFYDEHGRYPYGWDELHQYMNVLEDGRVSAFLRVVI